MKKIKLFYDIEPPFNATEFPWINTYFDFVKFNKTQSFCKNDCVIVKSQQYNSAFVDFLLETDYKIIIEDLIDPMFVDNPNSRCFLLQNFLWFWYQDQATFKKMSLDTYRPDKTYKKTALCPMRIQRWFRDQLYERLQPWHNDMIISYNAQGKFLPADKFNNDHTTQDRYFNPSWYNDTYFSIAVETVVDGDPLFVTEKTFKPIAFYHPFVLIAQPSALCKLKSSGFVTYENLFNESYDLESDFGKKMSAIIKNIKDFQHVPYDNLTLEKIQHNYNRFWDEQLVKKRMLAEIVEPILNYAETR